MKTLVAVLAVLFLAPAFAADPPAQPAAAPAKRSGAPLYLWSVPSRQARSTVSTPPRRKR